MDLGSILAVFFQWSVYVIQNYGYPGVFLVSMISSASIFLPIPGFLFILAASPFLNPWILGVVAGAGMAIGELTGYIIGKGGNRALKKSDKKWLKRGEGWFQRGRGFLLIVIFAATPLPDDVMGILAGMLNYDWRKFLLASFIGKTIMNLLLALGGFYGINWIISLFGLSF